MEDIDVNFRLLWRTGFRVSSLGHGIVVTVMNNDDEYSVQRLA